MAPLNPNNTPRFRVSYFSGAHGHTFELRSHGSPSAIGTFLTSFLGTLGANVQASIVTEVQFAAAGSDIFNAVTTGAEGLAFGTGGVLTEQSAKFYSFVGRSSGGRRIRLYIYGATVSSIDYRSVRGESTVLDNARDVLAGAGSLLVAIDDITPLWKNYINAGTSAHWQKALRP